MNTKLRHLSMGEVGTGELEALINELVGIAQRAAHIKVANKTGGNFAKGTLVAFSGYDATLACPTVVKADANTGPVAAQLVLSEAIVDGSTGIAYTAGVVTGLVADVAVGTKVYLSETPGGCAFTAPADSGDLVQAVGYVTLRHASAGAILFFISAAGGGGASVEGAYTKPATGIPESDMAAGVQTSLGLADTATQPADISGFYTAPADGIPQTSLDAVVQNRLRLAQFTAAATLATLKLVVDDNADGSSAAAVTGAAVGAKSKTLAISLKDGADVVQTWFNGLLPFVVTETCTDAQIGAPTVTEAVDGDSIEFVDGAATIHLVYDTDAGATKSYAENDIVSFAMNTVAILGVSVNLDDADFTDTLVA
jgi:hypothetical protein